MPRIRTIKPEFWQDELISKMDPLDRLVFLGLISMADDFGRVRDNIKILDAFIFPNCSRTVRESVANLSRINRIRRGNSSNGTPIIEIVNWSKHQKVDKPQTATALPPICDKTKENTGEDSIRESFANHSRTTTEPLATIPGIRDQGSGILDQGSGIAKGDAVASEADASPPPSLTLKEFLSAWNATMQQKCESTDKRRTAFNARIRKQDWLDCWRVALAKAKDSPFCNGDNDRGWVADVDWFLRPDTVQKILEGKYDKRKKKLEIQF